MYRLGDIARISKVTSLELYLMWRRSDRKGLEAITCVYHNQK
ncbi:MAG: hypothetical protein H6Q72_952 [Firmicutes bacterium]|nr:hypothetical protein [Bacillota bacterium]